MSKFFNFQNKMKMNHHIIFIFFAISIVLCNATEKAPITKPFLHSPTQFLPPPLEEEIAKSFQHSPTKPLPPPLVEPQGKGRKKRSPPPPQSPPPPPPTLEFDHFKLALTWPATFCAIPENTCIDNWPMRFLIHGLWPGKNGIELKDCDKDKKMKPNFADINGALKSRLDQDWLSLYKRDIPLTANTNLWFYEWNKHGTCSAKLFNFHDYLEMGTILYRKDSNKIVDILQKKGIIHGKTFSHKAIFDAIFDHIRFKPQIQCVKIKDVSYLSEVRLCFTASKDPQYTDCDGYGGRYRFDCNADVYF